MLWFADLEKPIEVIITEFPEPINGKLFEASLQYHQPFFTSGDYLGRFESVNEAKQAARECIRQEKERRAEAERVKAIEDAYVSKTTYRL